VRRLEGYLRERAAASGGEFYFKSKFIADDLGMTPSQVGALIDQLRDVSERIRVEPWSYTNATTWRVEPRDED
jgi:hypothetical protein